MYGFVAPLLGRKRSWELGDDAWNDLDESSSESSSLKRCSQNIAFAPNVTMADGAQIHDMVGGFSLQTDASASRKQVTAAGDASAVVEGRGDACIAPAQVLAHSIAEVESEPKKVRQHQNRLCVDQHKPLVLHSGIAPGLRRLASITYINDNGDVDTMSNIDPAVVGERCPLLGTAFEESRSGPTLHLEALTSRTAKPFVRFLYTGSYSHPGLLSTIYDDVPTSLLLHCQLYYLGAIFDLVELKQQSYVNVSRQCEFGCSSPDKPIDLCAAIGFAYDNFEREDRLIDTIICYCVTCFLRHDLASDPTFQTLAYELRPLHQDLCKESRKRGFEDDTAAAIIQMPFKPYAPQTYSSREDVAADRVGDVVYHFHGCEESDDLHQKTCVKSELGGTPSKSGRLAFDARKLALRKKREQNQATSDVLPRELSGRTQRDCRVAKEDEQAVQASRRRDNAESDFEFVARPLEGRWSVSDGDSDSESFVRVERPSLTLQSAQRVLPIRQTKDEDARRCNPAEPEPGEIGSGSESEWSVL